MNNDSDTRVYDLPTSGMFRVRHRGSCVAVFNYCVADESGFFTKKQAKKLAIKLARKIEKSTVIETEKGFKLLKQERNNQSSMTNKQEVFVRYTRDEAIILFNYQPVLRIPTKYRLGDQEVDMCEELVDWVNQIVEDLNEHVILPDINKTKNENESRTRKS